MTGHRSPPRSARRLSATPDTLAPPAPADVERADRGGRREPVAFNVGRQAFVGWTIGEQAADLEAQVTAAEAENAARSASSRTSRATPT